MLQHATECEVTRQLQVGRVGEGTAEYMGHVAHGCPSFSVYLGMDILRLDDAHHAFRDLSIII